MDYLYKKGLPTIPEFRQLRALTDWPEISDTQIEKAFKHTLFSYAVYHKNKLVGCGRLVGDGGLYVYLQDIIVHPDYRGKGIGKEITEALMGYIDINCEKNTFIGLMAAADTVNFYKKFGFQRRRSAAPGIYQYVKQ
jgi:ribosomal protein S18 acetylase RimI-like enzyme